MSKRGFTVYKRSDSPLCWAGIPDTKAPKGTRYIKTSWPIDDAGGKRKAHLWASEQSRITHATRAGSPDEQWDRWVLAFFKETYGDSLTGNRYTNSWGHLYQFLTEREITTPRQLRYKHAPEYVTWCTSQKRARGTTINRNSAIYDVKVPTLEMQEAVRREYADGNPIYGAKLRKGPVNHAKAMSDAEIAKIRSEFDRLEGSLPWPERWRTVSFEIALHHGCRLRETSMPLGRVDTKRGSITFIMKGNIPHNHG